MLVKENRWISPSHARRLAQGGYLLGDWQRGVTDYKIHVNDPTNIFCLLASSLAWWCFVVKYMTQEESEFHAKKIRQFKNMWFTLLSVSAHSHHLARPGHKRNSRIHSYARTGYITESIWFAIKVEKMHWDCWTALPCLPPLVRAFVVKDLLE